MSRSEENYRDEEWPSGRPLRGTRDSRGVLSQQRSQPDESQRGIGLDSRDVTHQVAVQLQRLASNRITTKLLSGEDHGHETTERNAVARDSPVLQRYSETQLPVGPNSPSTSFLFSKRVEQGEATSGVHNYAVVLGTWGWAKSTSNRHAEIKLLLGLQPQRGDEILVVSEFKPCAGCKKDMEDYERDHGVTITVFYLIDYVGTGDGDKDRLRDFYKSIGKLAGGGIYVYSIVS